MSWFTRNKQNTEEQEKIRLASDRTQYQEENEQIRRDMLRRYCPIASSRCRSDCSFFSEGSVTWELYDDYGEENCSMFYDEIWYYHQVKPSCIMKAYFNNP